MAKNVFVLGLAPFFSCNFVDDVANPKPNILVNIVPVSHSVFANEGIPRCSKDFSLAINCNIGALSFNFMLNNTTMST